MSGKRRIQVTDEWLYTYMPVVDEAVVCGVEAGADDSVDVSESCERKIQQLLFKEKYGLYGQARRILQRAAIVFLGIICAFSLGTLGVQAFIILSSELDSALAEQYAREELERIVKEDNPLCTWTEETEIESVAPLYDCDDICFGYVYKLRTEGKATGYMQVNYLNRKIFTYCYSFDGVPAYEGLMREGAVTADKLYFFGNMDYCYKTQDGRYALIDGNGRMSEEEAKSHFQETMYDIVQSRMERVKGRAEAEESRRSLEILQALPLVINADFANSFTSRPGGVRQLVVKHEAPVAVTNMMLYFRESGESSLSEWVGDEHVFLELYYKMSTNSTATDSAVSATGTRWENIVPGIQNFCGARDCTPGIIGETASVVPKKIKQHLDAGELLLLHPTGFAGADMGLTVVAYTYTDNSIVISTGWDRGYHYYPFETIEFDKCVYVRY